MEFALSGEQLSVIDDAGKLVGATWPLQVAVGGSQPDAQSAKLGAATPAVGELRRR